jgi:regulator of protease activity HflC (stomatin/prohibitin superfamily)
MKSVDIKTINSMKTKPFELKGSDEESRLTAINKNNAVKLKDEEYLRVMLQDVMQGVGNINYKINDPQSQSQLSCGEGFCFYFGNIFLSLIFCFIPLLCGFFTVQPNEAIVIICCGKIVKIILEPGMHWYWVFGVTLQKVDLGLQTIMLKDSSVPDSNGSPLNVSAIVTFKVEDPVKVLYNVNGYVSYLQNQAVEVLKRVVSRLPYRNSDPSKPSLLSDTVIIGKLMKEVLQEKMKIAGVDIIKMELMEISYHPEVAKGLLQIQQAQAKLEARKIIVEGGVGIVKDALDQLRQNEIEVSKELREKIIAKLLVVVCSEDGAPQQVLKI